MDDLFSHAAQWTSRHCGRPLTFGLAIVVIWAVTGPVFHYSDSRGPENRQRAP
jgi:low affinity Fe/Cu permease